MTVFVRCQNLQERDDFDVGYDKTFNDRSHHQCLFYTRSVIPHDECRETCPGYTPEDTTQPSAMQSAKPPARRVAPKNSGISHEAMRREIRAVIEKIDAEMPSESELIEAKSRLTEQQAQLNALLEEQRGPRALLQRQIEEDAEALRKREETIVQDVMATARKTGVKRDRRRELPADDVFLMLSFGESPVRLLLVDAQVRMLYSVSPEKLVEVLTRLTGKPLVYHPLLTATIQLDAKLKRAHDELSKMNARIEEASVARTSAERAYARLLALHGFQSRERRDVLERVRILVCDRMLPALEHCCDPLEDEDVSDIRRFLDEARNVIVAPPVELPRIESRLREMRLP